MTKFWIKSIACTLFAPILLLYGAFMYGVPEALKALYNAPRDFRDSYKWAKEKAEYEKTRT